MAAIVSDMSQPLGRAVGNALEIAEALDMLEGHGPPELTEFAIELASLIVELAADATADESTSAPSLASAAASRHSGGLATERATASARATVAQALASGAGLRAFRGMIEAQGGDTRAFDDRAHLPRAAIQHTVSAERDGYLSKLDALTIAQAATLLGAGRERKGDPIDLSVGVVIQLKIGDRVTRAEPLAVLHANDQTRLAQAERELRRAVEISQQPVTSPSLILERLIAPSAGRPA
jgi:pyrimidine-nucleoside phosphorylase